MQVSNRWMVPLARGVGDAAPYRRNFQPHCALPYQHICIIFLFSHILCLFFLLYNI